VLRILLDADGEDLEPQPVEVEQCIADLDSHFRAEQVLGPTDRQAAHVARKRRAALRRLETILQEARPHARGRLFSFGETARSVILGRLGAGAESGLLELVSDELPDEEWLRKVASYSRSDEDERRPIVNAHLASAPPAISAILLLLPGRRTNASSVARLDIRAYES
jgi:hypothetical protein